MLKIVGLFLGALFLFLSSATSASAGWGWDTSGFTIGNVPAKVDENGNFTVNVNLSVSGQAGSSYYLRAAFSHPTTPTSYFGYTKNNAGNWYNGTPSPLDHTQFYRVTLDSNASWIGTIEIKPDPLSSNYKGTGSYNFKVGRYTATGSGPTWSDNSTTITITKTQNFTFASGWNLIGLTAEPIVATNSAYFAEDFLIDINNSFIPKEISGRQTPSGNKVLSVTRWYNGRYQTHFVGNSDLYNFSIVPGEGYFIKTNWPGQSTLSGLYSALSSIAIPSGYSMISFPRALTGITNAEQLLQAIQAQGIDVRLINRWFGGRWMPHAIESQANNFSITPGEGYFIRNFGSPGTFTLP